jgi:aryl-alcohol dehydrogenase-like predicted oxidoreductase
MKYTTIGRTGVRVSRICFGTMSFTTYATPDDSKAMFRHAIERGINFFDCANSYAGGRAETLLGECIAAHGCRDDVVLVSKVCRPTGKGVNDQGLSRLHIMREVERSLQRLRTDRIDFYFAHHLDPLAPVEETLRAFDDLRRQGKILYPAVSNWSAWRIAKALGVSAKEGLARFELIQPMYNLVKRQPELELFPLAEAEQLGAIVYSPLASGLLSGAYGVNRAPEKARLKEPRYAVRYGEAWNYEVADRFTGYARARGIDPAGLAVAWAMSHPAVTAPIIGPDTVAQLDGYIAALDVPMTAAMRAEISALAPIAEYGVERTVD